MKLCVLLPVLFILSMVGLTILICFRVVRFGFRCVGLVSPSRRHGAVHFCKRRKADFGKLGASYPYPAANPDPRKNQNVVVPVRPPDRKSSSPIPMILVLVVLCAVAFHSRNKGRSLIPPRPTEDVSTARSFDEPKPTWEVNGAGETRAEAEKVAYGAAREKVEEYLRQQKPPFHWTPKTDYVEKYLVARIDPLPNRDNLWRISLQVEVTPKNLSDMRTKDVAFRQVERTETTKERMFWLARILGALVVMLTTVAGYVHLDESSKGYYTGWLRLAAIAIVVASGASLFILG